MTFGPQSQYHRLMWSPGVSTLWTISMKMLQVWLTLQADPSKVRITFINTAKIPLNLVIEIVHAFPKHTRSIVRLSWLAWGIGYSTLVCNNIHNCHDVLYHVPWIFPSRASHSLHSLLKHQCWYSHAHRSPWSALCAMSESGFPVLKSGNTLLPQLRSNVTIDMQPLNLMSKTKARELIKDHAEAFLSSHDIDAAERCFTQISAQHHHFFVHRLLL